MPARRGPRVKISRRLGVDLELKSKGHRGGVNVLDRRPFPPGQHGRRPRRTRSVYLRQLEEKQKARFFYGVREQEMRRYVDEASRSRRSTGEVLVQLLERRLDNVLARLGLAATRAQARQFINHGHVLVDGDRVDVPSYLVNPGEEVRIKAGSAVEALARDSLDKAVGVPAWLELAGDDLAGGVLHLPERDEVQVPFDESLVVEFYSR